MQQQNNKDGWLKKLIARVSLAIGLWSMLNAVIMPALPIETQRAVHWPWFAATAVVPASAPVFPPTVIFSGMRQIVGNGWECRRFRPKLGHTYELLLDAGEGVIFDSHLFLERNWNIRLPKGLIPEEFVSGQKVVWKATLTEALDFCAHGPVGTWVFFQIYELD